MTLELATLFRRVDHEGRVSGGIPAARSELANVSSRNPSVPDRKEIRREQMESLGRSDWPKELLECLE